MPQPRPQPRRPQPRLRLVPKAPPRPSALALWHLLSLDAPTVAATWTVFIARCGHVTLPWTSPAAMFLAVWMLYAADRLLDARSLDTRHAITGLEPRHHFHYRHRRAFLAALLVSAIALALLLLRLDHAALHLYAVLGTLLAAWLLLVHALPHSHRLPKELAVGVVFPAAVFIPAVAHAPNLRIALLPAALLFAAVCTLNCLFVYAWEHPGPRPEAHWTTRFATKHLRALSFAVILLAVLAVALHRGASTLPAAACAVSVALLQVLDSLRARIRPTNLRAAADLVLLTPLALLFFAR